MLEHMCGAFADDWDLVEVSQSHLEDFLLDIRLE
jgi:hypothetical protein